MKSKSFNRIKGFESRVPMTYKEVLKAYGPRCNEFAKGCGCCEAWQDWDRDGAVTVWISKQEMFKFLFAFDDEENIYPKFSKYDGWQ